MLQADLQGKGELRVPGAMVSAVIVGGIKGAGGKFVWGSRQLQARKRHPMLSVLMHNIGESSTGSGLQLAKKVSVSFE